MFIIEKFGLQNKAEQVSLLNKGRETEDIARGMRYKGILTADTRVLTGNGTGVVEYKLLLWFIY